MRNNSRLILTAAAIAIGFALPAVAQTSRAEWREAIPKIAADIGVSQDQMRSCLMAMPRDRNASDEQRQKNRDEVLMPCLQKANPEVTPEMIRTAFETHRP